MKKKAKRGRPKTTKKVAKKIAKETMFIVGYDGSSVGNDIYKTQTELSEAFDNGEFDEDCEVLEVTVTKRFRAEKKLDLVKE